MAELCSKEKIEERKKLCEALRDQIETNKNEKQKLLNHDKEYMKMINDNKNKPESLCPHGKLYTCAHCQKTYPRKYLNKMPLKNH